MGEELEYTDIIVEKKYPIGYITINRPERRNAVGTGKGETIQQIDQAALEMKDDREIKVFVIKGAGDCFCSGLFQRAPSEGGLFETKEELPKSVEWVKDVSREPWARYTPRGDRSNPEGASLRRTEFFWDSFWNNPKPSIAQVHSYCLGAGLWLINVCDVVYATPTAIFSYPPIRRGASITMGILAPWLLGRRQTLFTALTGNAITAQEALNCGLITKIVPEDKMEEEVNKAATSIARVPPVTNMMSKLAINNYYEGLGIHEALRFSRALCMMTENSAVPGHYFDYYANIAKYGFREANRMQLEKHSFADDVIDRERARLKAQTEEK